MRAVTWPSFWSHPILIIYVGLTQYCNSYMIIPSIDMNLCMLICMYMSSSSSWRGMYIQFILLTLGM